MRAPEGRDVLAAVDTAQEGFRWQEAASIPDRAQHEAERKRIATVTARAALVALVLKPLDDGAWQVLSPKGQPTTVQSLQAAEALVYGRELVRADAAALMGRLVRSQEVL